MTKISLIESGGLMGRKRQSELEMDFSEEELNELRAQLQPETNPKLRDALHHVLIIGEERLPFVPEKLEGKAKKIVGQLMKALKA